MSVTEQQLREHFHSTTAPMPLKTEGLLAIGHRRLRARRQRRAALVLTPLALIATAVTVESHRGPGYELAGSGLTLAGTTDGPVQVDDDRVDLGDGIQAWREGSTLSIGYPAGHYAALDTSALTSQWGTLGHDIVVLNDTDMPGPTTTVVGTVQGAPTKIMVTIRGTSQSATIACFTQAHGWCSYKAVLPVTTDDHVKDAPTVTVS